jgi:hypothetical protein
MQGTWQPLARTQGQYLFMTQAMVSLVAETMVGFVP